MVAILKDLGLFTLRLVTGWILFMHGSGKVADLAGFTAQVQKMGFPLPEVMAPAAALSEFAGGILLILGLLTPLAALFGAGTMAVAAGWVHLIGRWPGVDSSLGLVERVGAFFEAVQSTGWEFALSLFAACVCILLLGPGRLSLDTLILRPFRRGRQARGKGAAETSPSAGPAEGSASGPASGAGADEAPGPDGEAGKGEKKDRDLTSLADLLPGD